MYLESWSDYRVQWAIYIGPLLLIFVYCIDILKVLHVTFYTPGSHILTWLTHKHPQAAQECLPMKSPKWCLNSSLRYQDLAQLLEIATIVSFYIHACMTADVGQLGVLYATHAGLWTTFQARLPINTRSTDTSCSAKQPQAWAQLLAMQQITNITPHSCLKCAPKSQEKQPIYPA